MIIFFILINALLYYFLKKEYIKELLRNIKLIILNYFI